MVYKWCSTHAIFSGKKRVFLWVCSPVCTTKIDLIDTLSLFGTIHSPIEYFATIVTRPPFSISKSATQKHPAGMMPRWVFLFPGTIPGDYCGV